VQNIAPVICILQYLSMELEWKETRDGPLQANRHGDEVAAIGLSRQLLPGTFENDVSVKVHASCVNVKRGGGN
jgi:hypothetical protein